MKTEYFIIFMLLLIVAIVSIIIHKRCNQHVDMFDNVVLDDPDDNISNGISNESNTSGTSNESNESCKDDTSDKITIYNYLSSDIKFSAGDTDVMIPAQSSKKMRYADIINDITPPNKFKVFTSAASSPNDPSLFVEASLNPSWACGPKELHLGMISTRYQQGTGLAPSVNVMNGIPFIDIHNVTNRPLQFNDRIIVPPRGQYRYSGLYHYGVPLGQYLKNNDGIFPTFQILKPISDIFYGVVSDRAQPAYGGFWVSNDHNYLNAFDPKGQMDDATFTGGPYQPTYLFEDGYY